MLGNLPILNLLSTVAMAGTGIMIDKSFFFFFYKGDKSLIKVYMCIFVSISVCQALALVKVGRNVYVIYMYI